MLVHVFRDIALRDPLLPSALLPRDWPGPRPAAFSPASTVHSRRERSPRSTEASWTATACSTPTGTPSAAGCGASDGDTGRGPLRLGLAAGPRRRMPMKINVEMDCTPEEARAFLGLPDLRPMQEELLAEMKERMSASLARPGSPGAHEAVADAEPQGIRDPDGGDGPDGPAQGLSASATKRAGNRARRILGRGTWRAPGRNVLLRKASSEYIRL